MRGVIENIHKNIVEVRINCLSSCAGCSQRADCGITKQPAKLIKLKADTDKQYQKGQEVELSVSLKTVSISLFFAYILPLLLVLSVLCLSLYAEKSETESAIYSLSILLPYYLILFYLNSWLKKQLEIRIK